MKRMQRDWIRDTRREKRRYVHYTNVKNHCEGGQSGQENVV